MAPRLSLALLVVLSAGACAWPRTAAAAGIEDWHVRVAAAAECAATSEIQGRLQRLVADSPPAVLDGLTPELDIEVREEPPRGFVAYVTADAWRGRAWRRSVQGETCADVVDAVEVVLRVALQSAGVPEGSAQIAAEPPAPPLAAAPPPAREAQERPQATVAPITLTPQAEPPRWGAGLDVQALTGMGPHLGVGPGGFVEHRAGAWGGRLEAMSLVSQEVAHAGVSARFSAELATLSACRRLLRWGPITSELCLGAELGRLRARGLQSTSTTELQSGAIWWGATRLETRQDWSLGTLRLIAAFQLRAPWSRERFVFERPEVEVHRVPTLALGATVGLARSF